MPIYEKEYQHGLAQEGRVLPLIRSFFQRDINKISERFSKHDYECADFTYELKSRRVRKNSFPDTIIGSDKVNDLKKPLILLFNFTDRLCYCEYDPIVFDEYKKELFGRLDRPVDEAKIHIHIPIDCLIDICDWTRSGVAEQDSC